MNFVAYMTFMVAVFVIMIIVYIGILIHTDVKENTKRKNAEYEFKRLARKYGFPEDGFVSMLDDVIYNSRITYRCENGAGFIGDNKYCYFWKKNGQYNFLELPEQNHLVVAEDDLISYKKTGDKKYISQISGGGGGGSSIGGAAIGGILGGSTGAIIGSRKQTQPITTNIITQDNESTIINLMISGKNVYFVFSGGNIYDELVKTAPSKELELVSVNNSNGNKSEEKSNMERLQELKTMFESELISSEEYEEKKKEILSEL